MSKMSKHRNKHRYDDDEVEKFRENAGGGKIRGLPVIIAFAVGGSIIIILFLLLIFRPRTFGWVAPTIPRDQ